MRWEFEMPGSEGPERCADFCDGLAKVFLCDRGVGAVPVRALDAVDGVQVCEIGCMSRGFIELLRGYIMITVSILTGDRESLVECDVKDVVFVCEAGACADVEGGVWGEGDGHSGSIPLKDGMETIVEKIQIKGI